MILIYLPAVLIVLYYAVYYYFTRNYNYWKKRNVAGPKPIPLFGNIKEYVLRQKNMSIVLEEYYHMFPKEKVVGIYRMTSPCLLIRDLDVLKHIMIKDFDLFKDRGIEFSSKGLGRNLFHADDETWSALRSRFSPIFTSGKLKNMFPLLSDRARLFLNHLNKQTQKSPEMEIHALVQKFTMSAIFTCAFGVDYDPFSSGEDEVLKMIDTMVVTPNYALEVDMMYPGLLKNLNVSIFPTKVSNFFDSLVGNIISQRNGKPSARGDFMDLILGMRQEGEVGGTKNKYGAEGKTLEITDDVIAAQAFVFYVAGYETSASTLGYLLYQLALNPDIQDRLRKEIDDVTKEYNGELTYESLMSMKYLDQVFNETLRMYPIVDPLLRKSKVDYQVPGSDVVIAKNQIVLISIMGIHHDEKYYPNPEVFDPERFNSKNVGERHPTAYLPFGLGPRNCIGMRFGTLQSKLCVAKIISNYRVEQCEKTVMKLEVEPNRLLVGPKEKIILNVIPRN